MRRVPRAPRPEPRPFGERNSVRYPRGLSWVWSRGGGEGVATVGRCVSPSKGLCNDCSNVESGTRIATPPPPTKKVGTVVYNEERCLFASSGLAASKAGRQMPMLLIEKPRRGQASCDTPVIDSGPQFPNPQQSPVRIPGHPLCLPNSAALNNHSKAMKPGAFPRNALFEGPRINGTGLPVQ